MRPIMKAAQAARNLAVSAWDPVETLGNQVKPLGGDISKQLFGSDFGFGEGGFLSSRPTTIGHEELDHARKEKSLKDAKHEDNEKSAQERERVQKVMQQYQSQEQKAGQEQQQLHESVKEMQEEVVKLAKAAGVETKIHLEQKTKKLGILDLKRLTAIIKSLRMKADSAQSGNELVSQRQSAKAGTGMMAWVSGKQMKIHEQGTMQLQG